MIRYKELNEMLTDIFEGQEILEGEETTGGAARSAHSDYGVHRVENPEQLQRLNAFLNSYTQREFIEPKAAIATLRHKFNTIGMDFEWNATSVLEDGNNTIPMTRFGGAFGKSLQTPYAEFETTDGIKEYNNGKGLNLDINLSTTDSGLYKIDAKIVESSD
tara:strand:+ start:4954 stop:5436 length:483 start_codon:yes stop_codon:yes gene_type:complete